MKKEQILELVEKIILLCGKSIEEVNEFCQRTFKEDLPFILEHMDRSDMKILSRYLNITTYFLDILCLHKAPLTDENIGEFFDYLREEMVNQNNALAMKILQRELSELQEEFSELLPQLYCLNFFEGFEKERMESLEKYYETKDFYDSFFFAILEIEEYYLCFRINKESNIFVETYNPMSKQHSEEEFAYEQLDQARARFRMILINIIHD